WKAPKERASRKLSYPVKDGDSYDITRMLFKDPALLALIKVRIPIDESISRGESRHTVAEAGLKYLVEEFCKSWEAEMPLGIAQVTIQDGEVKIHLDKEDIVRQCRVITTTHDLKDRGRKEIRYYRSQVYLDKETGMLFRAQNFDWPRSEGDMQGFLVEDYTYLNMRTNIGLTNKDFEGW